MDIHVARSGSRAALSIANTEVEEIRAGDIVYTPSASGTWPLHDPPLDHRSRPADQRPDRPQIASQGCDGVYQADSGKC